MQTYMKIDLQHMINTARAHSRMEVVVNNHTVGTPTSELTVIQRPSETRRPRWDSQRELDQLQHAEPSIRTVEASANAKIFLETYFDSLHNRHAHRRQRRMDFERDLGEQHLASAVRAQRRQDWLLTESAHLRKSRKLKIRSRAMTLYEQVLQPGGYKVIRALGKGSFGTVCLVQETPDDRSNWEMDTLTIKSRALSDQTAVRASCKTWLSKHVRSVEQLKHTTSVAKGQVYAMKVIRKHDMIKNSQEGHIRAERDFLVAAASSPWVVNLVASFQDKINLYLVMEYMIGGDFLSLLIKHDILSERRTKQYIAEMIMCVEAAHNLGWIHRDVKPDNFLISASGHLKIADFGLAFDGHWSHDQNYYHAQRYSIVKKFELPVLGDEIDEELIRTSMEQQGFSDDVYLTPREQDATRRHDPSTAESISGCDTILEWRDKLGRRAFARSLIGTSQYMAPEIIQGHEYDGRCDYWSVGVILFECLFGHTPFNGKDRDATKTMIVNHKDYLYLPPRHTTKREYQSVSEQARALIGSLLTNKESRLGSSIYWQNDMPQWKHHGRVRNRNFVYSNDALQIKSHPFFAGLDWDRLHEQDVKFVPKISGQMDTSHFEDQNLSTTLDLFPRSSSQSDSEQLDSLIFGSVRQPRQFDGATHSPIRGKRKVKAVNVHNSETVKARPRDRILRDQLYCRDAMKLRKQNAFLGYTYRQPPRSRLTIDRSRVQ